MTEGRNQTARRAEDAEAEPTAEPTVEVQEIDELAALRQELEGSKAKESEYLDGWQRARAELANARKRFQREQAQSYENARGDVLTRLLPIVDDVDRAFQNVPADLAKAPWVEGVSLILRKLHILLDEAGVTRIPTEGAEFDPLAHHALTHEPSDTVPAGFVIAEMQRGYRLGERVLRPAMVRVSSGPAPAAEAVEEQEELPEPQTATETDEPKKD